MATIPKDLSGHLLVAQRISTLEQLLVRLLCVTLTANHKPLLGKEF